MSIKIFFKSLTLVRRILPPDEGLDIEYIRGVLFIPDSQGGPVRPVSILYSIMNDMVYLKTCEVLHKFEFEKIFGFGFGSYHDERVISVSKDQLSMIY